MKPPLAILTLHLLVSLVDVCSGTLRDVVFVLDKSGSVQQDDFDEAVDFVYNVTKWLTIGPSNIQVSAVTFSTYVQTKFDLNSYSTNTSLLDAISNLKSESTGGGTYTFSALDHVRTNVLTSSGGARAGVPKAVVVLTDGLSANSILTKERAAELHADNVEVYAIGIGNAAASTNTELSDIASDPDSEYLQTVDMFQYLCALVPELVPKLDNETLNSDFFRCPTPAPTTPRTLTFLNKTSGSEDSTSTDGGSSTAGAVGGAVGAVAGVGIAAAAAYGAVQYANLLRNKALSVESIVSQYKEAPLGQSNTKFRPVEFQNNEIFNINSVDAIIPSAPPITTV
ncbi:collagen alpha-1(XIV) chain-like [Saccostrea cucullata]|uniref:collagen alpha-1(XIV) chain-like n=1 Tax=Saccostrea cuccullata TaxID=36930 RepID=UPI002ED534B6